MVLKIAIQINQASSLFLPAFHIPINFQVVSQTTQNKITGANQAKVLTI